MGYEANKPCFSNREQGFVFFYPVRDKRGLERIISKQEWESDIQRTDSRVLYL